MIHLVHTSYTLISLKEELKDLKKELGNKCTNKRDDVPTLLPLITNNSMIHTIKQEVQIIKELIEEINIKPENQTQEILKGIHNYTRGYFILLHNKIERMIGDPPRCYEWWKGKQHICNCLAEHCRYFFDGFAI